MTEREQLAVTFAEAALDLDSERVKLEKQSKVVNAQQEIVNDLGTKLREMPKDNG